MFALDDGCTESRRATHVDRPSLIRAAGSFLSDIYFYFILFANSRNTSALKEAAHFLFFYFYLRMDGEAQVDGQRRH